MSAPSTCTTRSRHAETMTAALRGAPAWVPPGSSFRRLRRALESIATPWTCRRQQLALASRGTACSRRRQQLALTSRGTACSRQRQEFALASRGTACARQRQQLAFASRGTACSRRLPQLGARSALPLVALLLALAAVSPAARAQHAAADGAAMFAELCARCHGVSGDGKGPEVLDRPARDFTAGGFSFGNTEAALVRTIGNGIPGSPMPAFGETTSREKLVALARHVLTLAPPQPEATEAETIVVVDDHPVVLRGALPPIADGASAHPRGLLLGLPGGLSFEYRVPDFALLGVRAGEFARRTDWTGRGGTPLEPLGVVLWLDARGDPPRQVGRLGSLRTGAAVHAELLATATPASGATLSWRAVADDGQVLALVDERPRALVTPFGSGFARTLRPREVVAPLELELSISPGEPVAAFELPARVVRREDGTHELGAVLTRGALVHLRPSHDRIEVSVHAADDDAAITLVTLLSAEWIAPTADELLAAIEEALAR